MRKKYLSALLFGALLVTSTGTFTSCKDYDDDINNLQEQITANADAIKALESKVEAGNWVTDVTAIENGFKVTFNDGQSYEIVNGKDGDKGDKGDKGDAGSEWTIGEDGFWYKDNVKTEYQAAVKGTETVIPTIKDGYWWLVNEEGELEATEYKANGAAYAIDANGVYTIVMPTEDASETIEIKLPKFNITSIEFAESWPTSYFNYTVATKDFKDPITGIEYKKDEIIPLIQKENKSGIDVAVVVNPIEADLTNCDFKLMASDNSTLFTAGVAREYDGELITRAATSGLKYVNFKMLKGLKVTDKTFTDAYDASMQSLKPAFAVLAGGVSTNYAAKLYLYEGNVFAGANYTNVKVGKTYSIFGESDSKAAGYEENYNFVWGQAVSYKLEIDKDYCDAYDIEVEGDKFTIGKYTDKVIPYTLYYTNESGEKKSSKGGLYVIKDVVANVELTQSHTLNVEKKDVVFSLDNVLNALTPAQKIEWKKGVTLSDMVFKSTVKDNGNPKYSITLTPTFVKKNNSGNWVSATAEDATGLKISVDPVNSQVIADTYSVDKYTFNFSGNNELVSNITLKLSNPTTLTRIASLFNGDNVVAYGSGNNGNGETFNVLSLYEQTGATFYKDGTTLKVEKGEGMNNTTGWNTTATKGELSIGKDNMYTQTAKVTITVPVFAGNNNNVFKDVIYVTAKSPIKEGSIEALKTTLELGQSKTATFTNADFKAADVWGTTYNLFAYEKTTGTGDNQSTTIVPASANIKSVTVEPNTSLVKSKVLENNLGFTLTVDNEAALQSGSKVKITIKIVDNWGIETVKEVELTVVK